MHDYQTKGCSKYGASMGRTSNLDKGTSDTLTIRRVPIDDGGYDPGGAYWGTPSDLYCVEGAEGVFYTRAAMAEAVKAMFPRASWAEEPAEASEDDLADMFLGYVEAMLFSSTDESNEQGGNPLDDNYTENDIADESKAKMRADCAEFAKENAVTLRNVIGKMGPYGKDEVSWTDVGRDFWFSRQGCGVGFNDGDYPEPEDEVLQKAAQAAGEVYPYVGDDGKIYCD
jgi:hypothetical protein